MNINLKHFPSCTANYPEKTPGEAAQAIHSYDIGDGETAHTCVDCGSCVITDPNGRVIQRDTE